MKSKMMDEVLAPLGVAQFQPATQIENEMNVVYARSKNLKSRTKVVGSTAFEFDERGICKVNLASGRVCTYTDFQVLIKQSGISQYFLVPDEQSEGPAAVVPAPVTSPTPAPAPLPPAPLPPAPVTVSESEMVEALASGDMTLTEAREELDLPPMDGGDVSMAPTEPEPEADPEETQPVDSSEEIDTAPIAVLEEPPVEESTATASPEETEEKPSEEASSSKKSTKRRSSKRKKKEESSKDEKPKRRRLRKRDAE